MEETKRFREPVGIKLTSNLQPAGKIRRASATADQSSRRPPTSVVDTAGDEEYDDQLPGRMPKSVRRYRTDVQTEPGPAIRPAGRMDTRNARTVGPMMDKPRPYVRKSSRLHRKDPKVLIYIGLGMASMVVIWIVLSTALSWWNQTWHTNMSDPAKYGSLHGTSVQMVLGGGDEHSPSTIMSFNQNGVISLVIMFANDPHKMKSMPYDGPTSSITDLAHADVNLEVIDTNVLQITVLGAWQNGSRQQLISTLYPDGHGGLVNKKPVK